MMMTGALSMRWRDFSMRSATISSLCPSICNCCLQVSPMLSASCSLTTCRVRTTKRQGCRPCGEGAQRAASRICSMSSRETGRAWNVRALRLLFNSVAKSPVRAGNVIGRVPASVVATLIHTLSNRSIKRKRYGKCSRPFSETGRQRHRVIVIARHLYLEYTRNHE